MKELLKKYAEGIYDNSTVIDDYELMDIENEELIVAYHFVIKVHDEKIMTIGFDVLEEGLAYEVWELEGREEEIITIGPDVWELKDCEEDEDFYDKHWLFLYEIAVEDNNIKITSYS